MAPGRLTKRDAEALLDAIDDPALLGREVARCLGLLAEPGTPARVIPADPVELQDLAIALSERRVLDPDPCRPGPADRVTAWNGGSSASRTSTGSRARSAVSAD